MYTTLSSEFYRNSHEAYCVLCKYIRLQAHLPELDSKYIYSILAYNFKII